MWLHSFAPIFTSLGCWKDCYLAHLSKISWQKSEYVIIISGYFIYHWSTCLSYISPTLSWLLYLCSNFVFFFQECFSYLGSLAFPYVLEVADTFLFTEQTSWDYNWHCIASIELFARSDISIVLWLPIHENYISSCSYSFNSLSRILHFSV